MPHPFREYYASQEIALRVLLPIKKVRLRFDLERIRGDRGAAMRRRAQPDDLGRERYQAIVVVSGPVMECNANWHSRLLARPTVP
jgi:hypothetical protein